MGVYGSGIAVVINAPDSLQYLVASENLSRMRSKKIKDLNFLGSAGNVLALDLDGIVSEVDLKTGEFENGRRLLGVSESS